MIHSLVHFHLELIFTNCHLTVSLLDLFHKHLSQPKHQIPTTSMSTSLIGLSPALTIKPVIFESSRKSNFLFESIHLLAFGNGDKPISTMWDCICVSETGSTCCLCLPPLIDDCWASMDDTFQMGQFCGQNPNV